MDKLIRNVPATDVQTDEIWGFCKLKEGHKRPEQYEDDTIGDVWTWVALERNTKLVLAFAVGRRTLDKAFELTLKLRRATNPNVRFQLTSDGLRAYRTAVDEMLSDRCDFAQLIKFYSMPEMNEVRYSPARMIEANASPDERRSRSGEDLHVPRRASKPHHADANSTPDSANERLQQKAGESQSSRRATLRVLQFLPVAWVDPRDACNGSGDHGSPVGRSGTTGVISSRL